MAGENDAAAAKWLCEALGLKGGDTPFPWQTALLEDFRNGRLHPTVDIPTGLGKTSVMAIWLVARAWELTCRDGWYPLLIAEPSSATAARLR